MKDMKLKEEQAEAETLEAQEHIKPRYPYGLSLELNNESLEILKKKYSDFEAEEEFILKARVKVTSTSCYETMGSESQSCVRLQITELEMNQENYIEKRANKIYKKK
jgi:hypothetical protein